MSTAAEVIACARTWVGVPFLHQGRSRAGVDCIGLAIVVARELGLIDETVDEPGYGRVPRGGLLGRALGQHCEPIAAPTPGGLVLMRWRREPMHVAIVGDGTLLHSYEAVGRVVEHGFDAQWRGRVVQAFWIPGVERP
jgi:cell wall-associated NlpC family hydrolase